MSTALGHQFQRVYRDLLTADPTRFCSAVREQERVLPPAAPTVDATSGTVICQVMGLFNERLFARCWAALDTVPGTGRQDPRFQALEAARGAFLSGRLLPAIDRCAALVEEHASQPDLYAILGLLLLKAKKREEANAVFRRGARIDPTHPALIERIREMGIRRRPILPFLPRSHPANRILGRLRARLPHV